MNLSQDQIKQVYFFPGATDAVLADVGGKGLSLMNSSAAGLAVPPGFVLSSAFFDAWFAELGMKVEWNAFLRVVFAQEGSPSDDALKQACDALKRVALKLAFTAEQKEALGQALEQYSGTRFFAVRSSSPEEDLEGVSFAGGYETILGTTRETIESAIHQAFASCLDYRVVVYKREHHFDVARPAIAVVVQTQIASDSAGVGFSLNPVTNNFDEAVFNANWGLGETVVLGQVTPDTYVVNTARMEITSRSIGSKETSIWLDASGGTTERADRRRTQSALSDPQILELARLIKKVAQLYGKPIDIEWAFAQGVLYLLQARPITAYVPLAPEMSTEPGTQKRLYLDMTISIQGLYKPLSPMGTAVIGRAFKSISRNLFGKDISSDITLSPLWITSGRMYFNLSVFLVLLGKNKVIAFLSNVDTLASRAVSELDTSTYLSGNAEVKRLPRALFPKLPWLAWRVVQLALSPERAHARAQKKLKLFETLAREVEKKDLSVAELADELTGLLVTVALREIAPMMLSARIGAPYLMKQMLSDKVHSDKENKVIAEDLEILGRALPHNVTTQMGLALYQVAQRVPSGASRVQLEHGLFERSLPQDFMTAWNDFIKRYGHRGPVELDIASPRFRDTPKLLIDLMIGMGAEDTSSGTFESPQIKFERGVRERQAAYERLYAKMRARGIFAAWKFARLYKIFSTLAGYRETPKFYLIFALDLVRQRVVREGEGLIAVGRLDTVEQVFSLTIDDLDAGLEDASIDLRARGRSNRMFSDRLAQVSQLPSLFDSRGHILRPTPPPVKAGEIAGMPISAGMVRGRIKVLHTPDEKPLLRGEILVARATDPGWTPLFVHAGGVILEVGGALQHGALVAREYGLPCVAGIAAATTIFHDGMEVEMDGATGIIKTTF